MKNNILNSIYTILVFALITNQLLAQNKAGKSDDLGRIVLNSFVSDQIENLPSSAKNLLNNKMSQIATKNGVGGSKLNPRFIITPNISVLTKDITPTAPPMHALTLDVTIYIGDGIEGTKFASTSIQVKGVGANETKAYISALKRIKSSNTDIQSFVEEGKTKIAKYYNSKCDFIIKEAQSLESQNEFDAAILKLTSVPEVCKECYDKCMDAVAPIYQQQLDRECSLSMSKALAIWSGSQDEAGAKEAATILANIDPDSKCIREAGSMIDMLYDEMKKRIKEIDQREWDFKVQEQRQESERIKAIRDIGVAYGNNQPKNVTYNANGWW
ncbi:MAG: hypothetical protein MK207_11950 [Saprospiraceae bacterium]|nr:hypothetical protein [Saprospiraceae bacterium]